jgi:hypothetical protein
MEEEGIGFELVAASLRCDAQDSKAFLSALATKLSGALPQQTNVQYRGGLMAKKSVKAVEVDLADVRYRLEDEHGRLSALRQKVVRGIVLKNETIPVEQWIDELSQTLSTEAQQSESGRAALQQLLERS